MNIRKAISAEFANAVLNDPGVRAEVADPNLGTLEVSHLLLGTNHTNHMILEAEYGIVILAETIGGCWEFHPAILPVGRGKWAIEFGRAAEEFMFCRTSAIELLTRIAVGHKAGEAIALRCGFHPRWERPDCVWHGRHGPYRVWSLTLQEWLADFVLEDVVASMWAHGLERKAIAWYNRWAALSREPIWDSEAIPVTLIQGGFN